MASSPANYGIPITTAPITTAAPIAVNNHARGAGATGAPPFVPPAAASACSLLTGAGVATVAAFSAPAGDGVVTTVSVVVSVSASSAAAGEGVAKSKPMPRAQAEVGAGVPSAVVPLVVVASQPQTMLNWSSDTGV